MRIRPRLPRCSYLVLVTLGACAAPGVPPAPASPPMASLADAARGITAAAVQRHLDVLANDSLKGRDTDRPEIWTAARYIAQEFERDGLRPLAGGFIQSYRLTNARLDTAGVRLSVGGTRQLRWGQDFAMGGSDVAEVHGPLQYLGTVRWGTPFPAADVAGAVVLARVSREDFVQGLTLGALELEAERGAVAWGVVVDAPAPPGLLHRVAVQYAARVGSRPTLVFDPAGLAALLAGSHTDATSLLASSAPLRLDDVQLQISAPKTSGASLEVPNVVALLEGSDPVLRDEVVVFTAHFDHVGVARPDAAGDSIYNGADDNASGTVALLEIARAFASLRPSPARSVLFAAVSGEELGKLGSRALAAQLTSQLTSQSRRLVANLNMDMLGRNAPDSLHVLGQELSTLMDVVRATAADPRVALQIMPVEPMDAPLLRMSDQISFLEYGVPALLFNSGVHADLHTPNDETDRLSNDKIARAARLVFLSGAKVADARQPPAWTAAGEERLKGIRRARR